MDASPAGRVECRVGSHRFRSVIRYALGKSHRGCPEQHRQSVRHCIQETTPGGKRSRRAMNEETKRENTNDRKGVGNV